MYPETPDIRRLIGFFYPHFVHCVALRVLHRLDGLLRTTTTKEFANAPLFRVMLNDPPLTFLENNRQQK